MPIVSTGKELPGGPMTEEAVARPTAPAAETLWRERFAQRTQRITSSMIRELLKLTEKPDIISFAGGLPAPEVFPVEEIRAATERVLKDHGTTALQYTTTEGYRPLRELLVRHMSRYGVDVKPENVLVTSGSQQALDLIGKLLINPGDRVLTEAPTYLGALQAFNAYQADYLPVPVDDDGMDVDALEEQLRGRPEVRVRASELPEPRRRHARASGRRRRLVERAASRGIPIVEDDPYGQLRYEGEHLPSLVKLDAETHGCANGEKDLHGQRPLSLDALEDARAGPEDRVGRRARGRHLEARPDQAGRRPPHLDVLPVRRVRGRQGRVPRPARAPDPDRLRGERATRCSARSTATLLRACAGRDRAAGSSSGRRCPRDSTRSRLLDDAIAEKVAFVPGAPFYPCGGGERTMRLNFSYAAPDVIEEGIKRLCKVIERKIKS